MCTLHAICLVFIQEDFMSPCVACLLLHMPSDFYSMLYASEGRSQAAVTFNE